MRVEPDVYRAAVRESPVRAARVFSAPTPARVQFLDLPLLRGDEDPISPHVAVARKPWAGAVAVYSANQDFGYALDLQVRRPAVTGTLLDPLPAGRPGMWMGAAARVRLGSGSLQSRSELDVLNGANVAALRSGSTGDWEVVQFRDAELVGPREYRLDGWLRGQAGTDAVIPDAWPVGTDFVLLDGSVKQVLLAPASRGLERHYRVGPANRSYEDPSFTHISAAFDGVGLRPYRPVHLRRSGAEPATSS